MIRAWKCKICDHVYFGAEAPDRCPYCGVHGNNISPSSFDAEDRPIKNISEQTKKDLYKALRLEYEDANHYRCAAENSECPARKMIFDTLYDQEIRHAHIIEHILGLEEDSVDQTKLGCIGIEDPEMEYFEEEVFKVAIPREREAIFFYNKIARETDDPRIKEVFLAISDAEYHHSLIGKAHS